MYLENVNWYGTETDNDTWYQYYSVLVPLYKVNQKQAAMIHTNIDSWQIIIQTQILPYQYR